MADAILKQKFFSIRAVNGATLVCLFDEGQIDNPMMMRPIFSVVHGADDAIGHYDRRDGTVTLHSPIGEMVFPPTSVLATSDTVTMLHDTFEIGIEDPDPSRESSILYPAWFWGTSPAERLEMAKRDVEYLDAIEEVEIDEDEAYERMMDPERIAVARAYASA
jgi:hypothetical protein